MKKRRKGRIREFEQSGMQCFAEERRNEQAGTAANNSGHRKRRIKFNKGRLILAGIIIVLIAVIGVSVKNIFDLRAEQAELKKTHRDLLKTERSLEEELKNVNDLDYVEEQARIQLRMIKPGEILYIMDDEEAVNSKEDEKQAENDDDKEDN